MKLTSPAFQHDDAIPTQYTCDGENINPPLTFDNVPEHTQSFVLIMDDPDIPEAVKERMGIEVFDHWVLYNIPPNTREIKEREIIGTHGNNSRDKQSYIGACPPPEFQPTTHRYFFKLYALDTMLDLAPGASKTDVEHAMEGHIIDRAEIMATYDRSHM